MRLLLDTHVLLWWLADSPLSDPAAEAIADTRNEVLVSAASAWEVSIKKALGKLTAPDDLVDELTSSGFTPLNITLLHGMAAGSLPRHHDDPFDRMLVAQATLEGLTVVTRDARFGEYDVPCLSA